MLIDRIDNVFNKMNNLTLRPSWSLKNTDVAQTEFEFNTSGLDRNYRKYMTFSTLVLLIVSFVCLVDHLSTSFRFDFESLVSIFKPAAQLLGYRVI